MAKINRFNGNLKAPASEYLGTERTIFGGVTQSDELTDQFTTALLRGWGIVGPSDQPTLQDFNAMGFTLGQLHAYLHQVGVPEWNDEQEYHIGSFTNHNSVMYVSLEDDNVGNDPESSPDEWETYGLQTTSSLDTVRIDVASASTVNLTTAAPDTRHINITGTTTINGFTVAAGRCYFVRFAGALTLTNSASLVTQRGENIVTVAGDTCVIRATANNVVEVMFLPKTAQGFAQSSDIPFVAGGTFSFAHNLGKVPRAIRPLYKCLIAQHGWVPGDVIDIGTWIRSDNSVGVYGTYFYDITASGLNGRFGPTRVPYVPVKTTGLAGDATAANWALVIEVTA